MVTGVEGLAALKEATWRSRWARSFSLQPALMTMYRWSALDVIMQSSMMPPRSFVSTDSRAWLGDRPACSTGGGAEEGGMDAVSAAQDMAAGGW